MTNARLRMSLFLQNLRLKLGEQPFLKLHQALDLGREVFEIRIPVFVDNSPAKQIPEEFTVFIETLAEYDFRKDLIKIYSKRLNYISRRFCVNPDTLIPFLVVHELGHAKESRLCQEAGLFPHKVKVSPAPIPFKIGSMACDLRSVIVDGIGFPEIFLNGISDFAVNKELLKHGFVDPLAAKAFIFKTLPKDAAHADDAQLQYAMVEKYCLLALNVDTFLHKNIDTNLKMQVETDYRQLLGDKWDRTLEKMEQLELTDPLNNLDITRDLLKEIFGVFSCVLPLGRNSVFGASQIPKFWSKDMYKLLFLA